jgi:hypothetical protein
LHQQIEHINVVTSRSGVVDGERRVGVGFDAVVEFFFAVIHRQICIITKGIDPNGHLRHASRQIEQVLVFDFFSGNRTPSAAIESDAEGVLGASEGDEIANDYKQDNTRRFNVHSKPPWDKTHGLRLTTD